MFVRIYDIITGTFTVCNLPLFCILFLLKLKLKTLWGFLELQRHMVNPLTETIILDFTSTLAVKSLIPGGWGLQHLRNPIDNYPYLRIIFSETPQLFRTFFPFF